MKLNTLLFGTAVLLTTATATPSRAAETSPAPRKVTAAQRSWVTLQTTLNKKVYGVGEEIQVNLTATNRFTKGAYLKFSSGQRFDFSIYKVGQNDSIYTWSATRMFMQMVGSVWLKPAQSQQYEATVGSEMGTLQPGKYRLVARLTNSSGNIVAAPVEFEVAGTGLSIKAKTDKSSYKIGEPVNIGVTVANTSGKANTVHFNSGMTYDVIISDPAGKPIWNYLANLRFIRVLGDVAWQKNESRSYTATWNGVPLPEEKVPGKLTPGRYRVQAVLQSNPTEYAEPVYIDLTN